MNVINAIFNEMQLLARYNEHMERKVRRICDADKRNGLENPSCQSLFDWYEKASLHRAERR